MSKEMPLFDYDAAYKAKINGMLAASSYPFDQPVERARSVAIMLAKRNKEVCADDVHAYLHERMPDVLERLSPNSWGSIMRSDRLVFSGRITESKRLARHCGTQRIWLYAEKNK